ncbi:hypothetical protein [Deinococcus seoulensis]|uniref:hypothetical protein n=1 Tax=Deinococcus seoulensis TaxID=1837379 RepID=UPI00166431AA|nr:hypothetical protein [Deinococcus seoulensis]
MKHITGLLILTCAMLATHSNAQTESILPNSPILMSQLNEKCKSGLLKKDVGFFKNYIAPYGNEWRKDWYKSSPQIISAFSSNIREVQKIFKNKNIEIVLIPIPIRSTILDSIDEPDRQEMLKIYADFMVVGWNYARHH